jgi:tetratricopeptide (TPR) repeat protein
MPSRRLAKEEGDMHKLRWLLVPVALFWLTGYQARSLDDCLKAISTDCALTEAIAAAATVEDGRQRAGALSYIARVQADIGREADARSTLAEVLFLKRDIMDAGTHDWIAANLARVYALLGDFAKAMETAAGIGDPMRLTMAYTWIAQSRAHAKDREGTDSAIAKALAAAEDLPREQLAIPFAQMAIAQARIGDKAETQAIADSARKLSDSFNNSLLQARVATIIAVAESAAGAQGRAKASLGRAKGLLAEMESADAPASELASVLAYLAWAQALTGDREGALASIEPLKALIRDRLDTSSQSSQLAAIALVLVEAH